jgi:Tol biopolymer transport system component
VYLISPLGPPERKVTEIGYWHWLGGLLPWTPDGKSLVVSDTSSTDGPSSLFLLPVETGERRQLTYPQEKSNDIHPALSSDGRALAFVRELNVFFTEIYVLALSEDFQPVGDPKRLTFENRIALSPAWTLDGQEIIFSSGPYGNPNLFWIAVSGSGKPNRLGGFGEDGSDVATSRRAQRLAYSRALKDVNIWRLEVPGPHKEMSPSTMLISSTRIDWEAQFSPDGRKIAFNSNRSGSFEVWICDSDGSNAQPLTSLGDYCGSPSWSPDGERIAFDSPVEGQWDLYVVSLDGGKPQRLTTHPAADALTRWSRDGRWIYFVSDRSGENQIWKMPADGGEAVQVTQKGGFEAAESTDSQWVYYTKGDGAISGLWRMPRDGGEETQVLKSVDARAFAVVKEGIYFIPRPDSAGRHSIQFFNFATKTIRSISVIERPVYSYLSVSADGRCILYSQGDQEGSDLMLVENFR